MYAFWRKHSISKCHMVHRPIVQVLSVHMFLFIYLFLSCCRMLILHGFHSAQRQGAWVLLFSCSVLGRTIFIFLSSGFFSPNRVFGSRYRWHVRIQAALPMIKLCQSQTLPATNDLIDLLRHLSVTVSAPANKVMLLGWQGACAACCF